jgi:hypothetical protein
MSILSDIFNPTLLIVLGITLLLLALLVLYFENKMRTQNHKIASMLSLVSSLAEESGMIKTQLNHMNNGVISLPNNMTNDTNDTNVNISDDVKYFHPNLITVSDNDADDDSEDENSVNDSENDSDDSDSDSDDSDQDSDVDVENMDDLLDNDKNKNITINEINVNDIKVLNLDNLDNDYYNVENENEDDDDDILEDLNFDKLSDSDNESESNDDEKKAELESNLELNENSNLRSIKISTLEEDKKSQEVIDYKKLSLIKLKSIVVERGLVQDSSKLKKPELLKLLNVE